MSTITIAGKSFPLPTRYAEGHTLTANEAAAMNQLLGENLRNNFASKVKTEIETHGEALPEEALAKLHADFHAYAGDYEFGVRRARGSAESADPIAAEALKLTIEKLNAAIKAKGGKVSAYKEAVREKAEAYLADRERSEAVWKLAAERVSQKQSIVEDDLGDMLDGMSHPAAEPTAEVEAPKKSRKKAA